ncbi:MAG TPA: hypothetical protein DCZ11_01735, partial [Gammaproteobacteria bacterium]|nr:hypothetical protein [Gammaproteobacteria bacterium]MCH77146.1 hypothetical protein [Gammaproteobacteria bacterium]
LTNGSADNNAYVGCVVYVHDVASAVQCCMGVVSAYTGSTKTVTLAADPGIFTMAATDNICILPRANVHAFGGTAVTGRDIGASVLLSSGTGTGQVTLTSGRVNADLTHIATAAVSTSTAQLGVNVVNAAGTAWGSGAITAGAIASNAITSAKIATDAIGAAQLAADAVAEIQSGLATAAALATVDGIVDDIVADTNELQTD